MRKSNTTAARKRDKTLWLEEYEKCGCTNVTYWREFSGYCAKHGNNARRPRRRLGLESECHELKLGLS